MQGAFGSKLKGVQQLDAVSTSANMPAVDAHLDMLRPAIASYGAKVEVRRSFARHLWTQQVQAAFMDLRGVSASCGRGECLEKGSAQ